MKRLPLQNIFLTLVLLSVAVWIVLLGLGLRETGCLWNAPLGKLGPFGDMFGSINALFSGIAMSGAIYALVLQSWQIGEQKSHDHEMLRREKLECLANKIQAIRDRMTSLTSDITADSLQNGDCVPMLRLAQNYLRTLDMEVHLLAALYFKTHPEVLPQGFRNGIEKPLQNLISANSTELGTAFTAFSESSLSYFVTCGESLVFIIENSEKIIAGKLGSGSV